MLFRFLERILIPIIDRRILAREAELSSALRRAQIDLVRKGNAVGLECATRALAEFRASRSASE